MSRYIDADELKKVFSDGYEAFAETLCEIVDAQPTADVVEVKHGEWIERNVTQDRRDAKIPEWQSAKCSVCGKYHTTPYMYYFTNYDYCPNCGADMRGDEDEIQGKK